MKKNKPKSKTKTVVKTKSVKTPKKGQVYTDWDTGMSYVWE